MTKRDWITHAELADVLDVNEAALHKRRSVGAAPAGELRQVPGMPTSQYRYDVAVVRKWIRDQRDGADSHFTDCLNRLREVYARGRR